MTPTLASFDLRQREGHTEVGVDCDNPQAILTLNRVRRVVSASLLGRICINPVFQFPQAGEVVIVPAIMIEHSGLHDPVSAIWFTKRTDPPDHYRYCEESPSPCPVVSEARVP